MKILILGGTAFVGRAIAQAALDAGHEVALLHRGKTPATGLERAREFLADRAEGFGGAESENWDVVIDTSGYVPRIVSRSVAAFAHVPRYVFISTISVYAQPYDPERQENADLAVLEDPAVEEISAATYGGLKVLCEAAVREGFGDRATIVRPGLISGPYDKTLRFVYWAVRGGQPGPMLGGGDPEQAFQVIDARDLAAFTLSLAERNVSGIFNAVGEQVTLQQMVEACQPEPIETVYAPIEALAAAGLENLPLVTDEDALFRTRCDAALAQGLSRRPLSETAADTRAWALGLGESYKPLVSYETEERAIRAAWVV